MFILPVGRCSAKYLNIQDGTKLADNIFKKSSQHQPNPVLMKTNRALFLQRECNFFFLNLAVLLIQYYSSLIVTILWTILPYFLFL